MHLQDTSCCMNKAFHHGLWSSWFTMIQLMLCQCGVFAVCLIVWLVHSILVISRSYDGSPITTLWQTELSLSLIIQRYLSYAYFLTGNPSKLIVAFSINLNPNFRYQSRQVNGREGIPKARKSVKIYEYLALLFGTVMCWSFPCAADVVDPAANDKYLLMAKLLLGTFRDLIANIISVSSEVYIISRSFNSGYNNLIHSHLKYILLLFFRATLSFYIFDEVWSSYSEAVFKLGSHYG